MTTYTTLTLKYVLLNKQSDIIVVGDAPKESQDTNKQGQVQQFIIFCVYKIYNIMNFLNTHGFINYNSSL